MTPRTNRSRYSLLMSAELFMLTLAFLLVPLRSDVYHVTTSDADDSDPYWSPDGNQIAFSSDRSGNRGKLIRMLADGRSRAVGSNTIFWDGKDAKGTNVPSGIYIYSLVTDATREKRKMIISK